MGFLRPIVCASLACALGAACGSVDMEPFAFTPESEPEPEPRPFSLVVQGVGFREFDGAVISVRFPILEQERRVVIELGRFAVDYEVPDPSMLPDYVAIEYLLEGHPREPCEGDEWPVRRAEVPLQSLEGFAVVVVDHSEVSPEHLTCERLERH